MATGTVSFGLVSIPVKLYATGEPASEIHFNTLHAKCARSQNSTERPKPCLPKLKFMELPFDDDDERVRCHEQQQRMQLHRAAFQRCSDRALSPRRSRCWSRPKLWMSGCKVHPSRHDTNFYWPSWKPGAGLRVYNIKD